jgi:predicted DNA-binding protein with PD1-like motif
MAPGRFLRSGGRSSLSRQLEVVVVEASQHLRRRMRGEFGLALLDLSL